MNHGQRSEDTLEVVCRRIFGNPFVFRSPIINEPSGKNVELTDVLVLVGDTLVTIQSKSIDLDASRADEIDLNRIENKYRDAKRQINRTLNAATRGEQVVLESISGQQFSTPWQLFNKKIGIITINVKDELYADPEFRYQLPLRCEQHRGITVHGFILRDLFTMVAEFNTPGDFVRFLNDRELILSKTEPGLTNDLDLVASVKIHYDKIEALRAGSYDGLIISPGLWEEYRKKFSDDIKRRDAKTRRIGVVDLMIADFASNLDYVREQYADRDSEIVENHLAVLGVLGKLSRLERITITDRFASKYKTTNKQLFRYFMVPSEDKGLLFLIANEPSRETRKEKLIAMCCFLARELQANPQFAYINTIYGFVTEGKQLRGRSFDAVALPVAECLEMIKGQDAPPLFRFRDEGRIDEWTIGQDL